MCSRSAARPKCSSSATAMKQDSRASENTDALLASLGPGLAPMMHECSYQRGLMAS